MGSKTYFYDYYSLIVSVMYGFEYGSVDFPELEQIHAQTTKIKEYKVHFQGRNSECL